MQVYANGDLDNPHFKWDRKQSKSNVKEQIKDQKKEFNTIFKQDTIINKRKDKDLNDYKTQSSEIEMDDDW
jgi:fructose-specific phosphotransferase system component IIB